VQCALGKTEQQMRRENANAQKAARKPTHRRTGMRSPALACQAPAGDLRQQSPRSPLIHQRPNTRPCGNMLGRRLGDCGPRERGRACDQAVRSPAGAPARCPRCSAPSIHRCSIACGRAAPWLAAGARARGHAAESGPPGAPGACPAAARQPTRRLRQAAHDS